MLFDLRWKKIDKSLDGLIAWLKTQPKDKSYDYINPFNCVLTQYFRSQGLTDIGVAHNSVCKRYGSCMGYFPEILAEIALGADKPESWTFGKALRRAQYAARKRT